MKKFLTITALVAVVIVISLLIFDVYRTGEYSKRIDQIQMEVRPTEVTVNGEKMMNVKITVSGELPTEPVNVIIFTDNRYLEFPANKVVTEPGVTYAGRQAGGTEAVFSLSSEFDGEFSVDYLIKRNSDHTPLVYAFVKGKINNYLLGDESFSTGIFQVKD
ncbi:hypothetical protein [Brevibacillus brevis]|uniref:Uncharacterized protein n=1 Tax=Brevibacillus brevis TaxID=1393 RepID=A0A517IB66_BREBE|nr:hypothetical protein [Brevibacillus brevis]QDS36115.1 hypothetical protein FPS98_20035 [Brevibacillus brevis]